jgi:hypothetical protein
MKKHVVENGYSQFIITNNGRLILNNIDLTQNEIKGTVYVDSQGNLKVVI